MALFLSSVPNALHVNANSATTAAPGTGGKVVSGQAGMQVDDSLCPPEANTFIANSFDFRTTAPAALDVDVWQDERITSDEDFIQVRPLSWEPLPALRQCRHLHC